MKKNFYAKPKFKLPFILSAALHIAVLLALIIAAPVASYRLDATPATNNRPVVHASVIDSAQVQEQVQAIQSREAAKQAAEQQKVQQLQAQAQAAQQQKQAEEQRLAQIKADQQKALQQKQLAAAQVQQEQQRLTQLKAQQEVQAKAQALALKKQQEALAAKNAAAKAAAEKKQRELAAAQQKQAELAAKQKALQEQLMQEQIASEKQQVEKAQQMQGLVDQYRARILTAIANQWLIPDGADPTISCVFTIDLTAAGVVTHAQLIRSSGNSALDRSAETAIYKASPLPVPKDPAVFAPFQHFTLKMTPQDVTH